jgi:hypothetical protein
MSRGRPYHQWARTSVNVSENGSGFGSLPHTGFIYPLANTYRLNQIDDTIDHVLVDIQIGALLRATAADFANNDWPARVFFDICATIEAQGSGVIPDPIDSGGPDTQTVLTGSLTLVSAGVGTQPDAGYEPEPWARWAGSFASEGIRKSPDPTIGPATQVALRITDSSGMSAGPPLGPISDWTIHTYVRALHTSRVPF